MTQIDRFHEVLETRKPIIAMAHLLPLPGSPLYEHALGIDGIREAVRRDVEALQEGGVDAIMFGNEGDRPYLTRNGHLGHHASRVNPHYFDADQLYNLKTDPEETENVFTQNPETAQRMKKALSTELRKFENRPFGEFTR